MLNDLPIQRLIHSCSPPQVAESAEPGVWPLQLHLPPVLQGCEPQARMPRSTPCKAGRWASYSVTGVDGGAGEEGPLRAGPSKGKAPVKSRKAWRAKVV